MITEIVTFQIRPGMSRAQLMADADTTLERWRGFPGLIRKMYVLGEDRRTVKGIYLWQTREDAARGHDAAWLDRAAAHWGNRPSIELFDCFMILDNPAGTVERFG